VCVYRLTDLKDVCYFSSKEYYFFPLRSLAPQFFLAYNYYYLYILIYGILNFGTTTGSHSLTSSQTETINRNWRASRHLPTPPNGSQACVCVCVRGGTYPLTPGNPSYPPLANFISAHISSPSCWGNCATCVLRIST